MTRMTVKLSSETVALIDKLSGDLSRDKFLRKHLKESQKLKEQITKLKLEIERLRSEKAAEVSEPSNAPKTLASLRESSASSSAASTPDYPTKEEWLKSIQENNPPYEPINANNPLSVECYYHAYNPQTKKHYCEEKPIDGYACLRRYQRYQAMKKQCVPIGRKKRSKQEKWVSKTSDIFRGHDEKGEW